MLASLLPGLRDLRAPLAADYLWLAAGWLYFAPQLPASVNDADGVLKDIYRVAGVADASNPVAIAAGLTFIAYLLGILLTGLLTPLVSVIWTLLTLPIVLRAIAVDSIDGRIKERQQGIHLAEFADDDLWASLTSRRRWTTRADRKFDLLVERASTAILTDPKTAYRSFRSFLSCFVVTAALDPHSVPLAASTTPAVRAPDDRLGRQRRPIMPGWRRGRRLQCRQDGPDHAA
jgi:hypothetical protein